MELLATPSSAIYRLIYLQPDAEQGDRACVGVLFQERGRRARVLFDRDFSRLKCIAPSTDIELYRFYMDDFRAQAEASSDLEIALRTYGPQLTLSPERALAAPLTSRVEQLLLERHALRDPAFAETALQTRKAANKERSAEVADFVDRVAQPLGVRVMRNASASAVLGRPVRSIGRVAAAIKGRNAVVLIDGVDLRHMSPRKGVSQAHQVIHTFWQYGRLKDDSLLAGHVRRVGIVLNGVSPRANTRALREAHDYAMDQFRQDADLAVDTSAIGDIAKLSEMLSAAQ